MPESAKLAPSRLLSDPITLAVLVVWVLGALPYAVWTDHAGLVLYERLGLYPPLLALIVVAALYGLTRLESARERQFWALIAMAFGAWLASYVPYWLVRRPPWPLAVDLSNEIFYLLFYVCLLLAVDTRPHLATTNRVADVERWLKSLGAVIVAFAAALYFVVVPAAFNPSEYRTELPSLLLYLALDAFVLLRLIAAATRCRSRRWQLLYGALAVSTALMLCADGLEYLSFANVLPIANGRPTDLLWTVPLVAYAAAVRMRRLPLAAPPAVPFLDAIERSPARTGSFLVMCALSAPVVHFGLHLANLLDPAQRRPRQSIVLGTCLVLGGLAVAAYRLLERERQALRLRQQRLESQLRQAGRTQALGELAKGFNQDFTNLLQVVSGRCEALLHALPADSPLRQDVLAIDGAARQITTFAAQVFDLAQMEFAEPRVMRLSDLLRHFEGFIRALVTGQIRIEMRLRAARDVVRVDSKKIERALIALAANARNAMPEGGTLVIETFDVDVPVRRELELGLVAGPYAAVSLTDNGRGMSPDTLQQAFRPFFTTNHEKDRAGLGLTQALHVASHYGGTIHLESEIGRGTTATMYLPRAEQRVIDTAAGSVEHTLRLASSARFSD